MSIKWRMPTKGLLKQPFKQKRLAIPMQNFTTDYVRESHNAISGASKTTRAALITDNAFHQPIFNTNLDQ